MQLCPKCGKDLEDVGIQSIDDKERCGHCSHDLHELIDDKTSGSGDLGTARPGQIADDDDGSESQHKTQPEPGKFNRSSADSHTPNPEDPPSDYKVIMPSGEETFQSMPSVLGTPEAKDLSSNPAGRSGIGGNELMFGTKYELMQSIGEGGMGEIRLAKQRSLGREVAVKIPTLTKAKQAGSEKREEEKRLFQAEAFVLAKLEHPNIVPVYDMGTDADGKPVYAMKRLHGWQWKDLIADYSEEENLDILLKACDAIAFAHDRNIVHLDIKPENIWVGGFGEVLVIDWGIAFKYRADDGSEWTNDEGMIAGYTPHYAAPEMFERSRENLRPHTDVYLLGAALFEAIVGKAPHQFDEDPNWELARNNKFVNTEKKGGLLDIAYLAMSTNPADRYESVEDFQDAIRDYQSHGESTKLTEKAKKTLNRGTDYGDFQKAIAGFENALSLWPENEEAIAYLNSAQKSYARAALTNNDFDLGLSILESIETPDADDKKLKKELTKKKEDRDSSARKMKSLRRGIATLLVVIWIGGVGAAIWIYQLNKNLVKEKENALASATWAKTQEGIAKANAKTAQNARIDAEKSKEKAVREKNNADREKKRAIANENLAIANEKLAIENEKLANHNANTARRNEKKVREVSYQSEIRLAATTAQRNAFDDVEKILQDLKEEKSLESKLRHWESGHLRFVTSGPDDLEAPPIWDFRNQNQKSVGNVESVAMAPTGAVIAGTLDGKVYYWSDETQKPEVYSEQQAVQSVAIRSDGKLIAWAGKDDQGRFVVKVKDVSDGNTLPNGHEQVVLEGHKTGVLSIDFSPNGSQLLSSAADGTARLWPLSKTTSDGRISGAQLKKHLDDDVWSAKFSHDGQRIVTAGEDGFVFIWSVQPLDVIHRLTGHEGPVYTAEFTSDDRFIVSGGEDRQLLLWPNVPEPKDGYRKSLAKAVADKIKNPTRRETESRDYQVLGLHDAAIRSVSTAQRFIFSASHDNTVKVWDTQASPALQRTLRGHGRWVRSCDASTNGTQVLSGSYDGRIRRWDWERHHMPMVLAAVADENNPGDTNLTTATYSPDGNWIATGSVGGQLMVWDMRNQDDVTAVPLRQGHDWLTTNAVYFQNGNKLLTSGGDNKTIIWDAEQGRQLLQMGDTWNSQRGGTGWYGVAAVSADDKVILTGGQGKMPARLWDSTSGREIWDANVGERLIANRFFAKKSDKINVTAVALSKDSASRNAFVGTEAGVGFLLETHTGRLLRTFAGHEKRINAAVFLRDQKRLMTASSDGTIRTWSLRTGREIERKQHNGPVTSLSLSGRGESLLAATGLSSNENGIDESQSIARLWDVSRSAKPRQDLPLSKIMKGHRGTGRATSAVVRSVALHPDNKRALITTFVRFESKRSSYLIGEWNLDGTYQSFGQLPSVSSALYAQKRDGATDDILIVGGKGARRLSRKGPHEKPRIMTKYRQQSSIEHASFSHDSQRLVTAGGDGSIVLWKFKDNKWSPELNNLPNAHPGGATSAVFHPLDSNILLTAGRRGGFIRWKIEDASGKTSMRAIGKQRHAKAVNQALFSHDGTRVLTVSDDKTARIWQPIENGFEPVLFHGQPALKHDAVVTCGAFSSDRKWIVTGAGSNATVWDAVTGEVVGESTDPGHLEVINSVAFSHDSRRVLTSSDDLTINVWDTRLLAEDKERFEEEQKLLKDDPDSVLQFKALIPLEEHAGAVKTVSFSPNGQHVLSAGSDGQAIIWHGREMEPVLKLAKTELEYQQGSKETNGSKSLGLTNDSYLIAPTLADFSSAVLTVSLQPLARELGFGDEKLIVPAIDDEKKKDENFGPAEGDEKVQNGNTLTRKIEYKGKGDSSNLRPSDLEEIRRKWESLIRAITYTCVEKTEPVGQELAVKTTTSASQKITIQLENIKIRGVDLPTVSITEVVDVKVRIAAKTGGDGDPSRGEANQAVAAIRDSVRELVP